MTVLSYIALLLVAFTSLLVEVLLTKIFDVLLWPNLSFLIISCAMFGIGLGGLVEVMRPIPPAERPDRALARTALLLAASVWVLPLVFNAVPFSFEQLGRAPITQLGCFLLLYVALLTPFFFAGLFVCRLFAAHTNDVHRLYFFDLAGASAGTALLIPLLPPLGPERLLACASLAPLCAAALLRRDRRWRASLAAAAVVVLAAPFAVGSPYLTLAMHDDKRSLETYVEEGRLEFSRWDPVSHISVVDQPANPNDPMDHGRRHIAYDGGSQSSDFFHFDGDLAALRRDLPARIRSQFWQRGVLAAHYAKRDTGARALIIGSAGGQETKAALLYGASHVDAVEMVGTVVDLGTGRYADYIGRIFERPQVSVHVGEGRSFLRASRRTYDVIQVFSNYTTSSAASGSGAVAPEYLQTEEAYEEYFTHLAPDGILQVNHLVYPRIITTAAAAWRALGRDDFRAHVLVFEKQPPMMDLLPTVLVRMTPWTPAEVADLSQFFAFRDHEDPYHLAENPLAPAQSYLPAAFYSGDLPASLIAAAPFDITPATDDRPYFRFMRKSLRHLEPDRAHGANISTTALLNTQLGDGWIPMDSVHLAAAAAASVFYGVLFVLIPMLRSAAGRERWRGKRVALVYFSLLGVAFIAVELLFIQVLMKLVGYPLYAVATVITTMLIAAATGSFASERLTGPNRSRWPLPFAGVLVCGVLTWACYPDISTWFIGAAMVTRIAVCAAMIFPVAFFMGMPFPLGMRQIADAPRGAVAWAWAMNGLFTTIGGVVAPALSLWIGFRDTMLVAFGLYVAASITFALLRRAEQRSAVAPSRWWWSAPRTIPT